MVAGGGFVTGVMVTAGVLVSGVEVGFIIGVVVEGVVLAGVIVGTVVIGVVMSFWLVEIEEVKCNNCFTSWSCSVLYRIDIFFVKIEPVVEMK